MRIETRTKIVSQQYNVFIADDGTEFAFRDDCENYEEKQKKIEVRGVIWYDRSGKVLPLTLASWEKVAAIHFENKDADYKLYGILEKSECEMSANEQAKSSAFGDTPMVYNRPYLLLYDDENEVWEDVAEKYAHIKMWLDKI